VKWWLLKYSEDGVLVSPLLARAYEGQQRGICLCIGGTDENGDDVTNDLTYMLMDAFIALRSLNEPQLTLRVHPGTPKEVILKALEMLKLGMGYPSFFNDTVLVPLAEGHGLTAEEARSYMAIFCVNQSLPGNNICLGWAGWLNWAKVLLWDGTGLCLYSKRLERGRFARLWGGEDTASVELTMSELSLFLEGSRLVGKVPVSPRKLCLKCLTENGFIETIGHAEAGPDHRSRDPSAGRHPPRKHRHPTVEGDRQTPG